MNSRPQFGHGQRNATAHQRARQPCADGQNEREKLTRGARVRVHMDPQAARAVESFEARRADVLLPWGARVSGVARIGRVHVDVHVVGACAGVCGQRGRSVAQARDGGPGARGLHGGGGVQGGGGGRRRRPAPVVVVVVVVVVGWDEVVREHLVYAREGRHLECACRRKVL